MNPHDEAHLDDEPTETEEEYEQAVREIDFDQDPEGRYEEPYTGALPEDQG